VTHWTIGVDVGGTFTDFVGVDRRAQRSVVHKQPTDAADPARAVAAGIAAMLAREHIAASEIEAVVHGTTLGLNTLLQRKGARTALIVTRGFGDMLQIGRGDLPNSYSYKAPKPVPPIPRELVFELDARLRADGSVAAAPDDGELDALAARIAAARAESVALSVVNGYLRPEFESELIAKLRARLRGAALISAAALWPEIREYERSLVAVLNGLIHPVLDAYYAALGDALAAIGIAAPLAITTSTGGAMSAQAARARPIETVLSGPASGAFAAARIAAEAGLAEVVALDMGGTSSDITIITDGAPGATTETRLGDFPLMLPSVDIWAIGAGGGSIVAVDDAGVPRVGPESAGAHPGPLCYGEGGQATLTDCDLIAGFLNAEHFLGGRMKLDRGLAERGLAALGQRLSGDGDAALTAASAALRVAHAQMAASLANGLARRGLDARRFTLMAYGGAGPVHACALAEAAGFAGILIPARAATFCALGAALADTRRDLVRSRRVRIGVDGDAGAQIEAAVAALEREALDWIAGEGGGEPRISVRADLQYPRTAAVLSVELPARVWRAGDAGAVAELFHAAHEAEYGFRDVSSPVDVTALRLSVTRARGLAASGDARAGAWTRHGTRRVFWKGAWVEASVWRAGAAAAAPQLAGPALLDLDDTTIWIAPGWRGDVDAAGNVRMARGSTPMPIIC
jgi:N-methylhydantoinase A